MSDKLRAIFCDHLSIVRGKYLSTAQSVPTDTRFCRSTFGVHYDRDLLPSPGAMMMEGLPDMELHWAESDIRDSWEGESKVVIGDLNNSEGNTLPLCPRSTLKRAVKAWTDLGFTPKVGIELEAFAFVKNNEGELVPYDIPGGLVYGTGPINDPIGFNAAIWDMAHKLGFRIDMFTAEYDIPQFEYTLTFDEALKAVDDIVLFRQMAREIAFQHGVYLTFMPKPIEEAGGNGMHINFSLWDKNGVNASGQDFDKLNKGCITGLVKHHAGLAGLLAPSVNSFDRLKQGSLSGYWANWGKDHRNVTTRVSGEKGHKARLEHRMADSSANPYTAVAAVLQAARLGYENKYDLQPPETGDGFENIDAKINVGSSLETAIDNLEKDTALSEAIGDQLIENHIFMKRQEVDKCAALEGNAKRDFYLYFI